MLCLLIWWTKKIERNSMESEKSDLQFLWTCFADSSLSLDTSESKRGRERKELIQLEGNMIQSIAAIDVGLF